MWRSVAVADAFVRMDTPTFHLRVPSLHMSFSALTTWEGTRIVVSSMAANNTPHSWVWLSNKFRKKHNLVYKKRWLSNMRCLQYHFQGSSTRNIIQCLRMQYFSIKFASWGDLLLFQGFYSLSGKMSYHMISWSLEAARLDVIIIASLWNSTGISAVLLQRCLSNCGVIWKVWTQISRLRDFTRFAGKTSYCLVNRDPEVILSNSVGAMEHISGFVQECSISSMLAMEILQSYSKPYIYQVCRESLILHYTNITWTSWQL